MIRRIIDPMNHKHWDKVFSKVIRLPKMQYNQEKPISSMKVSVPEKVGRIEKKIIYKIDIEYYNEDVSSFSVDELIGED
ncbi:MAG: hypothetical protein ACOC33_02025 [bacterium]